MLTSSLEATAGIAQNFLAQICARQFCARLALAPKLESGKGRTWSQSIPLVKIRRLRP